MTDAALTVDTAALTVDTAAVTVDTAAVTVDTAAVTVDTAVVTWVAATLYTAATLAFLVGVRRVPESLRRYCYPLIAYTALSAVDAVLQSLGVATVPVGAGSIIVSALVVDTFGFVTAFVAATALAGATRRLTVTVAAVAAGSRLAFSLGNAAAQGTTLATLAGLGIVVGYPLLVWLLVRPARRAAETVSDRQRLLYWKVRNLLLFSFGLLVAFAFLYLSGLVSTTVVAQLLQQYPSLFLRIGVPALVVRGLATLPAETTLSLPWLATGDGETAATGASGTSG